ncbi:hypothetical protein GOC68_25785 [Sinorhizobium medicae]|nr:hypothetical protein [Sinorhizobium medicae]
MKVVVVTDPHVTAPGQSVHGMDTNARFSLCIETINEIAGDADLCVVMGDLVDDGSSMAYAEFRRRAELLNMPVRLLLGNHDNRANFFAANPNVLPDENGFAQGSVELENVLLLFLDTHNPAANSGDYHPVKLDWLKRKLAAEPKRPAYIFMHHPPFDTGFYIDHSKVVESEALLKTLVEAGGVRHVFVGHTHRASSGHFGGISWTALHGLANENDFELRPAKPNYRSGPAQIGILLIEHARSVLHFHDLLQPYPLIAYSGKSTRQPGPDFTASEDLSGCRHKCRVQPRKGTCSCAQRQTSHHRSYPAGKY